MGGKGSNILFATTDKHTIKLFDDFLKENELDNSSCIYSDSLKNIYRLIKTKTFDLVILDLFLSDSKGIETFSKVYSKIPHTPIVILLERGDEKIGSEGLRKGAHDLLLKNHLENELSIRLKYYLLKNLQKPPDEKYIHEFVCKSKKMQDVLKLVKEYARSNGPVLILGESGTGKDKIAEMIHILSNRRNHKFININCAAFRRNFPQCIIQEYCDHPEQIEGGTIFINEIGEIGLAHQRNLLNFIKKGMSEQQKEGATKQLDIRFIFATNKDLEQLVKEGRFSTELYSIISSLVVKLPPLRERREDIPLLANYFIGIYSKRFNRSIDNIEHTVLETLLNYRWPGNVRELRYVIEYACATTGRNVLVIENLPFEIVKKVQVHPELPPLVLAKEKEKILQALDKTNWRITRAASALGICRATLWHRMKFYNIQKKKIY